MLQSMHVEKLFITPRCHLEIMKYTLTNACFLTTTPMRSCGHAKTVALILETFGVLLDFFTLFIWLSMIPFVSSGGSLFDFTRIGGFVTELMARDRNDETTLITSLFSLGMGWDHY